MPHSEQKDAPLAKRQRVGVPAQTASHPPKGSRIFAPFRVSQCNTPQRFALDSIKFVSLIMPSNRPWA